MYSHDPIPSLPLLHRCNVLPLSPLPPKLLLLLLTKLSSWSHDPYAAQRRPYPCSRGVVAVGMNAARWWPSPGVLLVMLLLWALDWYPLFGTGVCWLLCVDSGSCGDGSCGVFIDAPCGVARLSGVLVTAAAAGDDGEGEATIGKADDRMDAFPEENGGVRVLVCCVMAPVL